MEPRYHPGQGRVRLGVEANTHDGQAQITRLLGKGNGKPSAAREQAKNQRRRAIRIPDDIGTARRAQ